MGLLKFGLCVVTWIILCVSKTNAEYKSLASNGTKCVDGQDILQIDPCTKCECVQRRVLCENVPCEKKKKNATRSGPDTNSFNEKERPPDLSNRRRTLYNVGNNEAISSSYQKPHMSSFYTKDSKVIEERRPNVSMILTQTREENILNTFLPQTPEKNGDDDYILIVPDETDENFQAQTGQTVSPTAFELPPGIPRPLARQPLVFGRPGDKRLLMRPRHYMRNDLKRGKNRYSQKQDVSYSNVNSNWNNKFNQQGSMSYPQSSNGNSDLTVYTPSQSAPFSQSDYYYPKEPIIYNNKKTNDKHFVDGKVRWKLAHDYPGDQMPQNNNDDQPQPMSDSKSLGEIPNNNDHIWNQAPGGNVYPGGKFVGGKNPIGMYPFGKYPGGNNPGGNYHVGNYPNGKYPGINFPDGKYPGGNYPSGKYPGGKYPDGAYPGGAYPGGNFPGGKYPGGNYPDGNYPGGSFSGGNYPGGKYPTGNYPDGKYSDGKYPDGKYPGGISSDGNNPGVNYPGGYSPGGSYPGSNLPSGNYPDGYNSGGKFPGGDNPDVNFSGGIKPGGNYPGSNNPDSKYLEGSNYDQYNRPLSLQNNDNLNSPNIYSEKTKPSTMKYSEYMWQKKQRRKKKKQKKLLELNEKPFINLDNDYSPNQSITQAFNKKKRIIKKKRKTKKKKQMMLYLDDDDDKEPTSEPIYDDNYPKPESDSPSYLDNDKPMGGNIPIYPDYGMNPNKRPKNNPLPENSQPFRPNQNGFVPGIDKIPPINTEDYPIPPSILPKGQDKNIDYKIQKLHKKKTFGQFNEPKLPINTPNYMSPQNKLTRPQAPDQNLNSPISNYQTFQPQPLNDDLLLNNKNNNYMLPKQKTPYKDYSDFSGEISKKKRKRKKKKNKKIMLSTQDTPDQDYPEISPDLAKKIKNILLSTQKTPYQNYPKITPELAKQIKDILLSTQQTPNQDYSQITPELANKLKHILLTTQKTPYSYPIPNKQLAPGIGFPQNPKRPNKPSPVINPYKPQRPQVPEMYPDYEPGYPNVPKKTGSKDQFLPVSLVEKPQINPVYDTNPMMYDYPHITEKPDEMKPIVSQVIKNEPQMYPDNQDMPNSKLSGVPEMYTDYGPKPKYKPQKPKNSEQIPVIYDEIKPISVQLVNQSPSKPNLPVDESPIMPVVNNNIPEKYPDYPTTQVSERPIVPLGIYPNKAQPTSNQYNNIPNVKAIESSIIPQTLDSELQIYPGYKPKPKKPFIDNKPKMYPDYEPAPIIPQHPTGQITEKPIIPIALGDEPQMYPNYEPKPNQYPGRPKKPSPKRPLSPVTYDTEPEIYIDDTPTPFIKPQPHKPQRPLSENPIIPVTFDSEPQMYLDFKPKPKIPVAESPIMPVSLDSEPEMYPDFNPKPKRPVGESPIVPVSLGSESQMYPDYNPKTEKPFSEIPIIPVSLGSEPQMYPDFNPKPNRPTSDKPDMPVIYDIEPEIYIDDTPEPLLNQSPPKPKNPQLPVTYDSEPQIYSDNEPSSMTLYKPREPVTEGAIIPQTFDNKLQMYPDYKSINPTITQYTDSPQQPAGDTPPKPVNDIGSEVYIDDTPTPTNEYDQMPQTPVPETFITPVVYDHVPEMYPADETAPMVPVNAAPQTFNIEPNSNNEPIPVFNHYTNLPEFGKPPTNNVPSELQMNNKIPEMYPDTNIPVFNNYPDLNKKPPNNNPQTYTPAPQISMPFTEDIPVFNSYPDMNKNPNKPQTFNRPHSNYPDFIIPTNVPKQPVNGKPQIPQPVKLMVKPTKPNFNKIYDIKMVKPVINKPESLPFGIPQPEQNLLELKKKRLSKIKYNNVRPTISMPYIGEGMENILDLSRFTDDMTITQTHLKQNMCKLCKLLDCIHPKRQDNALFPAIKILNEENELSEIIYKMLSKMRHLNTKYSHAPFAQEFEIIMPPVINQNKDIFKHFKSGTDYYDEDAFTPFMFPFGWPNSHGNEMALFNKFKSFKGKSPKNFFDGGSMNPHMFPGGVPFVPEPYSFGNGLPNYNNFMPFSSNKFLDPLSMMSNMPMHGIPMSIAEPNLSIPGNIFGDKMNTPFSINKFPDPLTMMSNMPVPGIPMSMAEPTLSVPGNIFGDTINTPLPDLNSIPPQNFDMGPDMGIAADDPMEHDDSAQTDKLQQANPGNFLESDLLNYTWQNPNAKDQGLGGPTGSNFQPESGQDGSLIPFDYFKSKNEANATNLNQSISTNVDMAATDGNVAADSKAVNAKRVRVRSKQLKRKRTNDGDLTYVRKSKGC